MAGGDGSADDSGRPALPKTRIASRALAVGRVLVRAGLPVAKQLVTTVNEWEAEIRRLRIDEWSEWVVGGADAAEFAAGVDEALGGPESDLVRAAILESARTAADAVDGAVISAIGLLTRRRLTTKSPDLRTFRAILTVLRSLERDEFEALRQGVHALFAEPSTGYETMLQDEAMGDNTREWRWQIVRDKQWHVLVRGEVAYRVYKAIEPLGGENWSRIPMRKCNLRGDLVALLADMMPLAPK